MVRSVLQYLMTSFVRARLWELETRKEISSVYGDFKIPEQVLQVSRFSFCFPFHFPSFQRYDDDRE